MLRGPTGSVGGYIKRILFNRFSQMVFVLNSTDFLDGSGGDLFLNKKKKSMNSRRKRTCSRFFLLRNYFLMKELVMESQEENGRKNLSKR